MHADLCACCARPKNTCENAQSESAQNTAKNPFAVLNHTDRKQDDSVQSLTVNEHTKQNRGSGGIDAQSRVKSAPQIVDDSLSDAFEIRKAVQVGVSP